VQPQEVKIVNPLQVEVNKKGKRRMCSDLRWPNGFLPDYEFSMENLNRQLKDVVRPGDVMFTTDIAKAYYAAPLEHESSKYICWRHRNKFIRPTILVFGLNLAPMIFTKLMRPMMKFMRCLGVRVLGMIDDYLWATEKENVDQLLKLVQCVMPALGWEFNDKCVFEASTEATFLGMIIDTNTFVVKAPFDRLKDTSDMIKKVLENARKQITIEVKQLEQITGKILSMMLALHGSRVWTRSLYRDIAIGKGQFHKWIYLSNTSLEELAFWEDRLLKNEHNGMPIKTSECEIEINVDAGELGYGGVYNDTTVQGDLPMHALGTSSTKRELIALRLAVKKLLPHLKGKKVKVMMDSAPAIRNLIKGGGPVDNLNEEIKLWFEFCVHNNIEATYEWIKRDLNQDADTASKQSAKNHALFETVHAKIANWIQNMTLMNITSSNENKQQTNVPIHTPIFDKISLRLTAIVQGWGYAVIVVPLWYSQAWWITLKQHHVAQLDLGTLKQVYKESFRSPEWRMAAFVIKAETTDIWKDKLKHQ
jgi:hypothetical protein